MAFLAGILGGTGTAAGTAAGTAGAAGGAGAAGAGAAGAAGATGATGAGIAGSAATGALPAGVTGALPAGMTMPTLGGTGSLTGAGGLGGGMLPTLGGTGSVAAPTGAGIMGPPSFASGMPTFASQFGDLAATTPGPGTMEMFAKTMLSPGKAAGEWLGPKIGLSEETGGAVGQAGQELLSKPMGFGIQPKEESPQRKDLMGLMKQQAQNGSWSTGPDGVLRWGMF